MSGKPHRRLVLRLTVILLSILAAVLFMQFGRSIWVPLKTRLTGKKTVASVVAELTRRRPEIAALIPAPADNITLIVLKRERRLELWADRRRVKTWPLTAFSGKLGPKLKEGDGQIPEGLYRPQFLHPNSSYHLSIKLDYPNEFDRKQAALENRAFLGTDIFIHGKNATIGCIPIGDTAIEELFYAVDRIGLGRTRIIIAPYDMRKGRDPKLEQTGISWTGQLYERIGTAMNEYVSGKI